MPGDDPMKLDLHTALSEFASTAKEWHYLIGGFAAGVVAGILLTVYLVLRVLRGIRRTTRRRTPSPGRDPEGIDTIEAARRLSGGGRFR